MRKPHIRTYKITVAFGNEYQSKLMLMTLSEARKHAKALGPGSIVEVQKAGGKWFQLNRRGDR